MLDEWVRHLILKSKKLFCAHGIWIISITMLKISRIHVSRLPGRLVTNHSKFFSLLATITTLVLDFKICEPKTKDLIDCFKWIGRVWKTLKLGCPSIWFFRSPSVSMYMLIQPWDLNLNFPLYLYLLLFSSLKKKILYLTQLNLYE